MALTFRVPDWHGGPDWFRYDSVVSMMLSCLLTHAMHTGSASRTRLTPLPGSNAHCTHVPAHRVWMHTRTHTCLKTMRRRVFSSGWNVFSDYLPSISRSAASVRARSRIHSPHTHTQLLDTCMGISLGATRHGADVGEEQDYHVAHSVWNLWWLHVSPLFRFFAPPHREASCLNTGTSSRLL
jgi:hypothetical protein